MKQTIPALMILSALLAGCGQSPSPSGAAADTRPAFGALSTGTSECSALYATAPSSVQVDSSMRYGQVGTLILSFTDDASKGRAVTWMDSTLPVDLGQGLGAFENLPMVALRTLITPELIETLEANLPGLESVYQDAPLHYLLAESVKFIGADTARTTYGVSGKGVGVAVIDSGIDGTHPDLTHVAKNVKLVGPLTDSPAGGYLYLDLPNTDTTAPTSRAPSAAAARPRRAAAACGAGWPPARPWSVWARATA